MGQNAIYYKGKSYTGGGGGSSTLVDLTDVGIDNPTEGQGLVYDATNQKWINGNVGSGGGSIKIVDELWSGNEKPTTSGMSINLAHSISDYDLIAFSVNNTTAYESSVIVSVDELEIGKSYIQAGYYNTCAFFTYTSDTEILIMSAASGDRTNYTKIEGIKFGGGSGGGTVFEGLDYSNAEDLTLPDNNGYDYTPTEDGALMVTSYGQVGGVIVSNVFANENIFLSHIPDRQTTAWCFVEKGVQLLLRSTSVAHTWPSDSWFKFIPLKQEGNALVNYSTTEQKIGTWIDGKPIYQITYELSSVITISSTAYTSFTPTNLSDIDQIISANGQRLPTSQYGSASSAIFARKQNNTFYLYSALEFREVKYITLQYTKTTD